MKNKFFI